MEDLVSDFLRFVGSSYPTLLLKPTDGVETWEAACTQWWVDALSSLQKHTEASLLTVALPQFGALVDLFQDAAAAAEEADAASPSPLGWEDCVMVALSAALKAVVEDTHRHGMSDAGRGDVIESLLLLTMFLTSFTASTLTHTAYLHASVRYLFELSLPLLLQGSVSDDENAEEVVSLLLSETLALRAMMCKRVEFLCGSPPVAHGFGMVYSALMSMRRFFHIVMRHAANLQEGSSLSSPSPQQLLLEAALHIARDLLLPLTSAAQPPEELTAAGQASASTTIGKASVAVPSPAALSYATVLFSSVLSELEGMLRSCQNHSSLRTSYTGTLSQWLSRVVNGLLRITQHHARSVRLEMDSGRPVAGGGSGGLSSVFSSFSVQQSMQRVLQAALTFPDGILPPATRPAAVTALASFGGVLLQQQKEVEAGTCGRSPSSSLVWTPSLLCRPRPLLPPLRSLQKEEQAAAAPDGAAATLSTPGKLTTLFGTFTAADLTEIVLQSLGHMDLVLSVHDVEQRHLQGLQTVQQAAAMAAQQEELTRRRAAEREDVEAVPAAELLERTNPSILSTSSAQLLRRPAKRDAFEKAAFFSLLRSYHHMKLRQQNSGGGISGDAEAKIRARQGLIARCLVQVPKSYTDSCVDAVLLYLREELHAAVVQGGSTAVQQLRKDCGSYYSLVLQILFMYFAALAPTRRQITFSHASQLLREEEQLALTAGVGGFGHEDTVLQTEAEDELNTEQPAEFMQEGEEDQEEEGVAHSRSAPVGVKRRRSQVGDGNASSAAGSGGPSRSIASFFQNDTISSPSMYSTFLCRTLEVVLPLDRLLLLQLLLAAPHLTRHVWWYLYDSLCLSTVELRCRVGVALLSDVAAQRESYRCQAVQLLLHLCISPYAFTRRLSIQKVGKLITATTTQAVGSSAGAKGGQAGASRRLLIGEETVQLLVRHARMKVAAVPAFQLPLNLQAFDAEVAAAEAEGGEEAGAAVQRAAPPDVVAAYQRNLERLSGQLQTHLGLSLMLCVRQPDQLIPSVLSVYHQCVDGGNHLMARLLLRNADVPQMVKRVVRLTPDNAAAVILPLLRRHSATASRMVQVLVEAVMAELKALAEDPTLSAEAHENLSGLASVVLAYTVPMWERSVIPLQDNLPVLHDFRFLVPLMAFLSPQELRETYLPQFLYFVQMQLQIRRSPAYHLRSLSVQDRQHVLSGTELQTFISAVLQGLFVRHPIPSAAPSGGRRITRTEFLCYLHTISNISSSTPSTSPAGGVPPISTVTTKTVIQACFDTMVSVPGADANRGVSTLPLFGKQEMLKVVRKLMSPLLSTGGVNQIPPQLMVTLGYVCARLSSSSTTAPQDDFTHAVQQLVMEPLARAAVWESAAALWRAVLGFVEAFYEEFKGFLVHLPDHVLVKALREHSRLRELFRDEYSNNAVFAHIILQLH